MARKIPVDFEEQVKRAAAPNGKGAPVQISAGDLMKNFRHCDLEIDQTPVAGLQLLESFDAANQRKISLTGALTQDAGDTLPDGTSGDILYHNGSGWVVLNIGSTDQVLTVQAGLPSWEDAGAASASHPWKCTEAGGTSIAVAAGKVIGFRSSAGSKPYYGVYSTYAGGNVTCSASGYIYLVQASDEVVLDSNSGDIGTNAGNPASGSSYVSHTHRPDGSPTLLFSTDDPATIGGGAADEIYMPVAQISVSGGIATVADQILTHNPILALEIVLVG